VCASWQLGGHPLFKRLATVREHKVFSKGREVADDLRERWETSDSPLVHRIQVNWRSLQAPSGVPLTPC
jgi:import inner membrane translocase subunit TIM44